MLDTDVVGTGTIVRVGESEWTIIVNGDLDGNGNLTASDIVLFKLDYIGEEKLTGPYLMAADMNGTADAEPSVTDLVLMLFKYNDIAMEN